MAENKMEVGPTWKFKTDPKDAGVRESWFARRWMIRTGSAFAVTVPAGTRGEGTIDPVFDKGMAVASGFLVGHQRCRPPYIGWSDATLTAFRDWLARKHPEFLCEGRH